MSFSFVSNDDAATRQAAASCLAALSRGGQSTEPVPLTPWQTIEASARVLETDAAANRAWVVRGRAVHGAAPMASAWPLWFRRDAARYERPLVCLCRIPSVAGMRGLAAQLRQRGVLCNEAAAWREGSTLERHAELPLWLADNLDYVPYDLACADEARAILAGALQDMYGRGSRRFYYLSAHDRPTRPRSPLDPARASDAVRGMYLARAAPAGSAVAHVRLLAAGTVLHAALRAARLLWRGWRIGAEVWSCPSYTRLAREARLASWHELLHPDEPMEASHLVRCLARGCGPVIAATAYPRRIAEQIGAHVRGPFMALGSDSTAIGPRDDPLSSRALALAAIKVLQDAGR
ncbi:hypothetical protein [Pigmentiphaga sp.]|uniref:transketolase-like TK C-terminal-containing protein n=1 Tax=Pigmentiphaga sp. TaxID=1977564 RepID=UPI0025EBAE79|nr:hypothetical protein [Pigmentiphaga sp.]